MRKLFLLPLLCTLACARLTSAVTECATGDRESRLLENQVAKAVSGGGDAEASLGAVVAGKAVSVVACVLWRLVQSWTAGTQADGELGQVQQPWTARDPEKQPAVNAIRKWLKAHGREAEPVWRVNFTVPVSK